jgi:hypothetical protein
MRKQTGLFVVGLIGLAALLACTLGGTAVPPTNTAPPPTTVSPPTDTTAPPTDTSPAPTDTAPAPTDTTAPPTDTALPPTESGPCAVTVTGSTTVYTRPSLEADVFGTLTPDIPIEPGALTADGWIGFDPGVAQAANVGPFRLRWVQNGGPVTLSGDCSSVPVIVGPPTGVCFEMFMETTDVHSAPDAASSVITTAQSQDYVAVDGQSGSWLRVDLSQGNLGLSGAGWIPSDAANFNGPCDSLPDVTP